MPERRRAEADPPGEANDQPLHIKYRPARLEDVWGQDAVVGSLRETLRARARPHTFLFTGGAGTGKTTLARIVAASVGVGPQGIVEHDAASQSGIDSMRALTEPLRYRGLGEAPNKAIILNECQGLSKQAWDALLDATEQPPDHVYFLFTSTDPAKIPKAMVTRAVSYQLRQLRRDDVLDILDRVAEAEGLRTPGKVLEVVADACGGSARHALTMLAKVAHLDDPEEAADLCALPLEDAEVIDLCRLMVKGSLTWGKLTETLRRIEDKPAETIRIITTAYLTACALGARSDRDAADLLDMLRAFSAPYNPSDKLAPLLLSFDRFVLRS